MANTAEINQALKKAERERQIDALRAIHRRISDEWGAAYFKVVNDVEAALSAMEEAHAEEQSQQLEA